MSNEIRAIEFDQLVITNTCVSPITISKLAALGEEGIATLTPLPVAQLGDDNQYYLLDGNKRAKALQQIGATSIEVSVREGRIPKKQENEKVLTY